MLNSLIIKILYRLKLRRLKKWYINTIALWNANDLIKLAEIYGSDKWGSHYYIPHYIKHFSLIRKRKLDILEIGVGGYDNPHQGGASLRMWKKYFPNSMIHSMDIYDKSPQEENRIKIYRGSQSDELFLKNVCAKTGPFDIIIDDGSHVVRDVITSFKILFPILKEGGIYVVEDTQTSYWPDLGGNSTNLDDSETSMVYFKRLADGLNHQEYLWPEYIPSYFDKHVVSIHFYHNMVFIYKGLNDELSSMVENGKFR